MQRWSEADFKYCSDLESRFAAGEVIGERTLDDLAHRFRHSDGRYKEFPLLAYEVSMRNLCDETGRGPHAQPREDR